MTDRRLDAMKALSDVPTAAADPAALAARRERVVAAGAATIRREARHRETRQKRARIFGAFAVAATLVLAIGITWRVASRPIEVASSTPSIGRLATATGSVVLTHLGQTEAVAGEHALAPDDEVATTPEARARMVLASGATVDLASSTRVRVRPTRPKNERVAIAAGDVDVRVPKLASGDTFVVETPDSEVTVHGTAFVVSVRNGASRVRVTEGVVSVAHAGASTLLRAGDEWPAPIPVAPAIEPGAPALAVPSSGPAPGASPATAHKNVDASTLAEQNRLLQRALDARRRGDDAQALEDLDRLLQRYPRSPLAQEARVEKFRALERAGRHSKAIAEARRYLADYPKGFAVDEAKALVLR